jgi:hypothetical protein
MGVAIQAQVARTKITRVIRPSPLSPGALAGTSSRAQRLRAAHSVAVCRKERLT